MKINATKHKSQIRISPKLLEFSEKVLGKISSSDNTSFRIDMFQHKSCKFENLKLPFYKSALHNFDIKRFQSIQGILLGKDVWRILRITLKSRINCKINSSCFEWTKNF